MAEPRTLKRADLRLDGMALNSNAEFYVEDKCVLSGATYKTGLLHRDQVENWLSGEYIQKAMPEVSTSDREFLMSGACPSAFDKAFGDDE